MEFPNAKVKSVKADIAGGEIRISFGLALNVDNLRTDAELGLYVDKDAGRVGVQVIPVQPPLMMRGSPASFSTSEREGEKVPDVSDVSDGPDGSEEEQEEE